MKNVCLNPEKWCSSPLIYAPERAFSLDYSCTPIFLCLERIPEQKKDSWFYRPALFKVSSFCEPQKQRRSAPREEFYGLNTQVGSSVRLLNPEHTWYEANWHERVWNILDVLDMSSQGFWIFSLIATGAWAFPPHLWKSYLKPLLKVKETNFSVWKSSYLQRQPGAAPFQGTDCHSLLSA